MKKFNVNILILESQNLSVDNCKYFAKIFVTCLYNSLFYIYLLGVCVCMGRSEDNQKSGLSTTWSPGD